MPGVKWLRRRMGRSLRMDEDQGITVGTRSDGEIAERRAQRAAAIADARAEAFTGAERLRLGEVCGQVRCDGVVYVGVDHADRLIVATSRSDPSETYAGRDDSAGLASFAHSAASRPYPVSIETIPACKPSSTLEVEDVPVAHPFFQPTAEGGFIVVGGRARHTDGGAEHNALVVDADGAVVSSFCIGDGVNDVQTTPSGDIWVSYFDEGVFGNYGWGLSGPEPLGRSGLARWTLGGSRAYEFSPPDGHPSIVDCYSLSVVGDDAWACYYTGFPVVHVRADGSVDAWSDGVAGVHALAVAGDRLGLIGGYRGMDDRLIVADLAGGACRIRQTFQLVMPDGADVPQDARVMARGAGIHVVADGRWLSVGLGDVSA